MEQLDVFDCSNVLIASYFADDRECAHENREHTLIYQCSGRLEIEERGKKTVLYPGDCAFMRRDNRMWLYNPQIQISEKSQTKRLKIADSRKTKRPIIDKRTTPNKRHSNAIITL